jgi:hypothetical protein
MDSRTVALQTNGISRLIVILWIHKKSRSDQNDLVATKDKVQQGLKCTGTHISCTVRSFHDKACTDSTNGSILYNKYSMQRLMSWKIRRSITSMIVWVDLYWAIRHAHRQQKQAPTMDSRTLALQTDKILTLILIVWIQKKSRSDQNDLMTTKNKVQQGLRCTSSHTSCTVPSSNKRTWIQFTS